MKDSTGKHRRLRILRGILGWVSVLVALEWIAGAWVDFQWHSKAPERSVSIGHGRIRVTWRTAEAAFYTGWPPPQGWSIWTCKPLVPAQYLDSGRRIPLNHDHPWVEWRVGVSRIPGYVYVYVPFWGVLPWTLVPWAWLVLRRGGPAWACAGCGYDLRGLGANSPGSAGLACPECGLGRAKPVASGGKGV